MLGQTSGVNLLADLDFVFLDDQLRRAHRLHGGEPAVILHYAIRRREVKTAWEIVRNVALPAIGVVLTVVLFIALLVMTRLFRRRLHMSLQEDEVIAEGDEGAEALLDDDRERLTARE